MAAVPAFAGHAWSNYHWARTSNPFTITVIDSHTADWKDNFKMALGDWNQSSVLDTVVEAGANDSRTRKRCPAIKGKVRSCNAAYGYNGWLGIASISVSGGHITQGTAKMNDSYLSGSGYDETARQHVICQEIGHDWGLGHQDESGADLNTCMDYADSLDNPSPNNHDYDQLETIYAHLDSTTTIASIFEVMAAAAVKPKTVTEILHDAGQWGMPVKYDRMGRPTVFVMPVPNHEEPGEHAFEITHVLWTNDAPLDERDDREKHW